LFAGKSEKDKWVRLVIFCFASLYTSGERGGTPKQVWETGILTADFYFFRWDLVGFNRI
jgi:hypothetical protein